MALNVPSSPFRNLFSFVDFSKDSDGNGVADYLMVADYLGQNSTNYKEMDHIEKAQKVGVTSATGNSNPGVGVEAPYQVRIFPGMRFVAEVDMKVVGTISGSVQLDINNSTAGYVTTVCQTTASPGEWTRVRAESIKPVPHGGQLVRAVMRASATSGQSGYVLFKNLDVRIIQPDLLKNYVTNGDFSQGLTGWTAPANRLVQANGESYIQQDYTWGTYQDLKVSAGKYLLEADIRRGTATSDARVIAQVLDVNGVLVGSATITGNISALSGVEWKRFSSALTVPGSAASVRIYVVTSDVTGLYHHFDNIRLTRALPTTMPPVQDYFKELVVNGDFSRGAEGWAVIDPNASVVNGMLVLNAPTGANHFSQQPCTVTPNTKYVLSGDLSLLAKMVPGWSGGFVQFTAVVAGTISREFTTPAHIATLSLNLGNSMGAPSTHTFDNISLKRKMPD